MSDELKITDLDSGLKKIFLDILVEEGEACPEPDEELMVYINNNPILRSLINGKYLAQKHSLESTPP